MILLLDCAELLNNGHWKLYEMMMMMVVAVRMMMMVVKLTNWESVSHFIKTSTLIMLYVFECVMNYILASELGNKI